MPRAVAVIGATEKAGSVGRADSVEPDQQPFWQHGLPGQSQTTQRTGDPVVSGDRGGARAG